MTRINSTTIATAELSLKSGSISHIVSSLSLPADIFVKVLTTHHFCGVHEAVFFIVVFFLRANCNNTGCRAKK